MAISYMTLRSPFEGDRRPKRKGRGRRGCDERRAASATNGVPECNLIGNYSIYCPSRTHIAGTTSYFHACAEDNWVDSNKNGALDGNLLTDYKTATLESGPFDYPSVTPRLSAQDGLDHVNGASSDRADGDIDARAPPARRTGYWYRPSASRLLFESNRRVTIR